ncbi:MAG TPA: AAA family ATPase [Methylococcaceae bacterium]|nr:AAA family ATPase [Methylococcaceae bacterium]
MDIPGIAAPTRTASQTRPHVLVFTSGKGGVGKTCIASNVGVAMARKGCRVCVFDADTGLANINILLDLHPEYTLEHVLSGEKSIGEVVVRTAEGLAVVPGASGIAECANINRAEAKRLADALAGLESEYDYFLIDTAAGVADSVLQFIESAQCAFVVITAEPTSLTDAFSLLKLLKGRNYTGRLLAVVNLAVDYPSATEIYRRFAAAVEKYLSLPVEYGGFVARDDHVLKSVRLQMPVILLAENSPASRCLHALADNVLKHIGSEEAESGLADYWKSLIAENEVRDPLSSGETFVDLRPAENTAETAPLAELTRHLLAAMKAQDAEREDLEAFLVQFVSGFAERFGSFPQVFRQLFYRWLEAENYAAPRLMEMVATLEALYIMRHQQPMFSLEDGAARLVAQAQGSETKLRGLIGQFRQAYRQAFQADVFDARHELLDAMRRDDFSEERFEELQRALREEFRARFNRPYEGRGELLLESTAEALAAMTSDERELQDEIEALSRRFQQLASRRDALLAAIRNASNPVVPLESVR